MQPPLTINPTQAVQQRLRRFIRQPDKIQNRQLTSKALELAAVIERYRFLPSSLLVRVAAGNQRNNYQHLQTLFHRGLVNRLALPKYGGPGEFIYFLDSAKTLRLLIEQGIMAQPSEQEWKRKEQVIDSNRTSHYNELHKNPDVQGQLLFIQHEIMVSRFHALLEMATRKFADKVFLENWKQGSELYSRVEVLATKPDQQTGNFVELDKTEWLPHRPDAFFTLYFPTKPEGQQRSNFLYEADRGTENTTRYKMKLRSHWHFIVNQQRQQQAPYNVHSIRAVLTESTGTQWAHNLREAAKHPIVSKNPSPLFWFTTSELLTKPTAAGSRTVPLYLEKPERIFDRIWASPVDDKLLNLAD